MKTLNNLLIEIGTEELPYTQLDDISQKVKKSFYNNFKKNNSNPLKIKNFITIRRIALIITNIDSKIANNKNLIIKMIEKSFLELKLKTKMRWFNNKDAFIRPIKWYTLLLNKNLINHKFFNIKSQKNTIGHKLIKNKIFIDPITYELKLKKIGHVICDKIKRMDLIKLLIKHVAKKYKANFILKKETLNNISNSVEYPSFLICSFKKEYLKIPENIIITTLLNNQFCILLKKKHLLNKIIIIIDSFYSKKKIKPRYDYIINTKLSEIKHLYDTEKNYLDMKNLNNLKELVLNNKIGNMYDKTIRIKNIAIYIASLLKIKTNIIAKTSLLLKMDLLTKINNEYPELTGLICGYNLKEKKNISNCLYNYNKILNNKIIKNLKSCVLLIADKIENITSFFLINLKPSGSKDPFNLKKESKLIIQTIIKNKINLNILNIIDYSIKNHNIKNISIKYNVLSFILQRLNVKKENWKLIKNKENIYIFYLINNLINNFKKYKFKNNFFKTIKRIIKITDKNKINISKKFNKNLIKIKQEKILYTNLIKQIKIINILNKKKLFFESNKTLLNMEKNINNYFNNVLVIDKNKEIMENRLKFLNILRKIILLKINWNLFDNNEK